VGDLALLSVLAKIYSDLTAFRDIITNVLKQSLTYSQQLNSATNSLPLAQFWNKMHTAII